MMDLHKLTIKLPKIKVVVLNSMNITDILINYNKLSKSFSLLTIK